MSLNLRDEDRRAVDLLLDRSPAAAATSHNGNGDAGGTVFAQPGVAQERLNRAERMLRMLDMLPAVDPPQDLVARTMRRLDETAASPMNVEPPIQIDTTRQHA